jgi:4-amino-4-deoxy-L-arabinose transferase-like glycosyltransferase
MKLADAPDAVRTGLSLLLLAGLTAVAMATRPIAPIDETRYLSAAWEMWLRGDFLVPHLNGEPYDHKPPLMFWTFHAGWALSGVNDWWPRLVPALFSAGTVLLTVALGRRLWPQHPGLGGDAALVLTGALLWILFSTAVMFDVLLAFWVLAGAHGVLDAAEGRRRGFALLAAAIGLGVLTKGPVVLLHLLPLAVSAPWWNPGLRWGRWSGGVLLAVIGGAAIALAWAIPAGEAGGAAYREAIFWGQTAERMVDSFAHQRPFWWYLPLLPVMLFPWAVWPSLWRALARHVRGGPDRGTRLCLAWMLPVFIAFSSVSGKQPHYLIPLFPAFALLAARALRDRPAVGIAVPAALAGALGLALIALALRPHDGLHEDLLTSPPLWPGIALLVTALASAWAVRRTVPATLALAALSAALVATLLAALTPALGPRYDIRPMAKAIKQLQDEGGVVANAAKYHAQYQFAGRLERPLVELTGDATVPWLAANPRAWTVVYLRRAQEMRGVPARHAQVYRGGAVVLVDAPTALRLLDDRKD